jgi:hypothetical protein
LACCAGSPPIPDRFPTRRASDGCWIGPRWVPGCLAWCPPVPVPAIGYGSQRRGTEHAPYSVGLSIVAQRKDMGIPSLRLPVRAKSSPDFHQVKDHVPNNGLPVPDHLTAAGLVKQVRSVGLSDRTVGGGHQPVGCVTTSGSLPASFQCFGYFLGCILLLHPIPSVTQMWLGQWSAHIRRTTSCQCCCTIRSAGFSVVGQDRADRVRHDRMATLTSDQLQTCI